MAKRRGPYQWEEVADGLAELPEADLAVPGIEDHTACQECRDDWVFHMADLEHHFSMGLNVVLRCLREAQEAGAVPDLPHAWWAEVYRRCDV